jgi:hypothetical protein
MPTWRIVADGLPIQMAIRTQSEAAAAALVAGIRRSGCIAESHWLIHSGYHPADKSTASSSQKSAVPVRCQDSDPDRDLVPSGRACGDRGDAADPGVGRTHRADWMVVYGSATTARLSQERTGFALGTPGFRSRAQRRLKAESARRRSTSLCLDLSHGGDQQCRGQRATPVIRSFGVRHP